MFSSVWNFLKRHRRKFFFTGAVIGGGVLLSRYVGRKFREWEEKELSEYCDLLRKDKHFESTQKTCTQTTESLVLNLKEGLSKLLDSDALTAVLKMNPANKLEVWEELKIISFMRTVVMVYSVSMLVVLLKVELNILGGYMYVDAVLTAKKQKSVLNLPQEVQRRFLNSVQHLLGPGLESLIAEIKGKVKEIVSPISLKSKLSLKDLNEIFIKIRSETETSEGLFKNFPNYLIGAEEDISDPNVVRMLEETKDILDNEDTKKIFGIAADCGFAHINDCLTDYFSVYDKSSKVGEFINPHKITVPLAKLVPILNNLLFSQCTNQSGQLVYQILQLESLKTLGANVYEAFSQEDFHEDLKNHNIKH